ncbi:DUF4826 domain-containing protein [Aliidiomarina iranensis]|uniref:DUF4826 domain-containing protein n=1 Tax=Aliidiomarina iranensis TaxID=1434071 RepID=A0A432W065_9GAMM|nr:DUF4826 family protein [Aliidiomarina iranensis]RUO22368.1 DUF4826 domain-containing protein [Aliidiomarina iranensis]
MSEKQQESNPEQAAWVREHFQKANGYLAEKGILTDQVLVKESRYLIPHIALWKFSLRGSTDKVWAISGVCPTDHVNASVAGNARDALKHFCLSWQLRADKILTSENPDPTEKQFAELLIGHAEACYQLVLQDKFWENQ